MDFVEQNQPKVDYPEDVINDIVGYYAYQDTPIFLIQADENTPDTGIFVGGIETQPLWFIYDKVTTEAYNTKNTYVFRYFSMPAENSDGCMINTMTGDDDGLVIFQNDGEMWTAAIPDYTVVLNKTNV